MLWTFFLLFDRRSDYPHINPNVKGYLLYWHGSVRSSSAKVGGVGYSGSRLQLINALALTLDGLSWFCENVCCLLGRGRGDWEGGERNVCHVR